MKLNKSTATAIADLHDTLDTELTVLREQYADHSDKWKDSDKGENVSDWIDDIEALVDALDNVRANSNDA